MIPSDTGAVRFAVVGHVEWVTFARVEQVPAAGEIVHAKDQFEEPAGGGAVAAVQLARLAGSCALMTALGEDEHGRRAAARLAELGVEVLAAWRSEPTRTAVTLVDGRGERTITTFGARLEPDGEDAQIDWGRLAKLDGVYFTAGDVGALRAARAARTVVASPRAVGALGHGVAIDALVLSDDDALERDEAAAETGGGEGGQTGLVVNTEGARGGVYSTGTGKTGSWRAAPLDGPPVDSYGCGDSFAAGLTYGLGEGMAIDKALALAARCGAVCLTGKGPYGVQLTRAELGGRKERADRAKRAK